MNVYFTAGRNGKRERGWYKFWILMGRKDENNIRHGLVVRTKTTVWARTKKLLPDEIEWFRTECQVISRAKLVDVQHWLNTHPDDAKFAVMPL